MNKEVKKIYPLSPMGQAINEIIEGKHSCGDLMNVVKKIEEERLEANKNIEYKELSEILRDLKPRV